MKPMELTLCPAPCAALPGLSCNHTGHAVRNSDSFGFCRLDTGYPTPPKNGNFRQSSCTSKFIGWLDHKHQRVQLPHEKIIQTILPSRTFWELLRVVLDKANKQKHPQKTCSDTSKLSQWLVALYDHLQNQHTPKPLKQFLSEKVS